MSHPEIPDGIFLEPTRRLACVIILDVSASMTGRSIEELNRKLPLLKPALEKSDIARSAVELAVVTCGGDPRLVHDWTNVDGFYPPVLTPSGNTPLGSALHMAHDLIEQKKATYKNLGVPHYKPWLYVLTDGQPTDVESGQWANAAQRTKSSTTLTWILTTDYRDDTIRLLQQATSRVFTLEEMAFEEAFLFLSKSLTSVSTSQLNKDLVLDPPPAQIKYADVMTINP